MKITGRTKITGLFGYPVEHTLSPAMHNAAFAHVGLDYCYIPLLVHPHALATAVQAIRALNLAGVNVTVPHKEAVIPLLDHVSEEATFIGAVNTIVNSGGRLEGYNTDGRGFMRSIEERGITVEGRDVLIAGAGGGSRAISYYLSEKAAAVCLFDTDQKRLHKLVGDLGRLRQNVRGLDAPADLKRFQILINATPLGLGKDDPSPFDLRGLTPEHTVCDLIYKKTRLLEAAEQLGSITVDGLGMLLWQGVLAFERWTGVLPPVDVMRSALLSAMA